jgi:hypothetical protein
MSTQPQESERRASGSVLCAALEHIKRLLLASPDFACPGVEVMTEDDGDIDTEIAEKLASLGTLVSVQLVDCRAANETLPGPVFGRVGFVVELAENALLNRSAGGRTCLENADKAAALLHHARLASGRTLLVTDLAKFPTPPPPATACYHVTCKLSNVSLNRKVQTT